MTHIGPKDYAPVDGVYRYMDTDPRGFPVVGVIRHGAKGFLNHYGLRRPNRVRGPVSGVPLQAAQIDSGSVTQPIPRLPSALDFGPTLKAMAGILSSALPPPPRVPWWQRVILAALAFLSAYVRVSDPEWHATVRDTMRTILMTSFVITSMLIFGKALWVVMAL